MSITTTYCPSCGQAIEAEPGSFCQQCQVTPPKSVETSDWVPNAQMPVAAPVEKPRSLWLDVLLAFLVWGFSGAFALGLEAVTRLSYVLSGKPLPEIKITPFLAIVTLVLTLVMQVVGLVASWMFVTRLGRKPFFQTLGWRWHPQFRWGHAVALAFLMFGVSAVLSKLLPHHETDLDKILKMGILIRVFVVVLAVLMAPLVEEIVYRGVVYSAVERLGGKALGVITVTVIFALVHVPQYWGSAAAITAIVSLSLVLTLLRAWTGSLLPCVVTHLIFNGVQGIGLLFLPDKFLDAPTQKAAIILLGHWLGVN